MTRRCHFCVVSPLGSPSDNNGHRTQPWWKVKDPEEWDDYDHQRWQKRQRRLERGLPSDSGED